VRRSCFLRHTLSRAPPPFSLSKLHAWQNVSPAPAPQVAASMLGGGAAVPYPAKPAAAAAAATPQGSARKLTSVAAAAAPTAAREPVTLGGDPKASIMAERQAARRNERMAARQAERKLRLRALSASKADDSAAADAAAAATPASSSLAVRATNVQPGPLSPTGEATVVVTHPVKHGYAFAAGSDAACVCAAHGYQALSASSSSSAQALPTTTTVASAEACFLWTCDSLRDTGCQVQDYVASVTCAVELTAASAAAAAVAASSSKASLKGTALRQLSSGGEAPNPLDFLQTHVPTRVPTKLPSHAPTHLPTTPTPTRAPSHTPTVANLLRFYRCRAFFLSTIAHVSILCKVVVFIVGWDVTLACVFAIFT